MRYKYGKKNIKFVITRFVFQAKNAPKSVFGRGSDPDPAGGAYDAPRPHSRLGRGHPLPIPLPARRLRRLRPLSTQNPGYATEYSLIWA